MIVKVRFDEYIFSFNKVPPFYYLVGSKFAKGFLNHQPSLRKLTFWQLESYVVPFNGISSHAVRIFLAAAGVFPEPRRRCDDD
jgi:hypothetical protein